MRVLLLSGLGPYTLNLHTLDNTLLGENGARDLHDKYLALAGRPVDVMKLQYDGRPVIRSARGVMPHLATETVRSILDTAGVEYERIDLEDLWAGKADVKGKDFDVVGLSTTFICDRQTLKGAIQWVSTRFPDATFIVGGQYSNLKYDEILGEYPEVDYIVRGDAELAFPKLLRALETGTSTADVPNLAVRGDDGSVKITPIEYIDIEGHPSPAFKGHHDVVPYESMRGCPFVCKFCSFPFASPEWRYKSSDKICRDWAEYADKNGAHRMFAKDSTFTIPPPRFRELLQKLPKVGVRWEAFTRANVIESKEIVDGLEASHCESLFIGFESMSDPVLKFMEKRVSVKQNRRAFTHLKDRNIDVRASFIAGYPGETPEEFEKTHRFIVDEYSGHFQMHAFTLQDETMPVWKDAELHKIEVFPDWSWKHAGMDSRTALRLRERTLVEARWKNEDAVLQLWQYPYERPLIPQFDLKTNLRVEKLIERLSFVVRDLGTGDDAAAKCRAQLDELAALGVTLDDTKPAEMVA